MNSGAERRAYHVWGESAASGEEAEVRAELRKNDRELQHWALPWRAPNPRMPSCRRMVIDGEYASRFSGLGCSFSVPVLYKRVPFMPSPSMILLVRMRKITQKNPSYALCTHSYYNDSSINEQGNVYILHSSRINRL